MERIKIIHAESKGRYGAPKTHYLLTQEGFTVSLKTRSLNNEKCKNSSTIVKKYRPTSSTGQVEERKNLLEQVLKPRPSM
ncbi:IS3 family transposase [Virgibacillus pantothenticus]|uniref:IS3 family transposase n=1 Tax=Virgibacillus pantothenticus TaxID=1473 RepID=UPI00147CB729|nr:IS3 family transposase [Virgibacillus pantothenticus]